MAHVDLRNGNSYVAQELKLMLFIRIGAVDTMRRDFENGVLVVLRLQTKGGVDAPAGKRRHLLKLRGSPRPIVDDLPQRLP